MEVIDKCEAAKLIRQYFFESKSFISATLLDACVIQF